MKTKMLKNCVSLIALATAALAAPDAAHADGDIVDIRIVDQAGKKFGERNQTDANRCTADNAFVAGEKIYFRVRFLVPNAAPVEADHGAGSVTPQTWKIVDASTSAAVTSGGPKLGLLIGNKVAYADYSDTGYYSWQVSGELQTDDNGNSTTAYRYYTDFYFVYTVKAGDMGLPIRLLNQSQEAWSTTGTTTDYAFYNVNVGTTLYRIVSNDGTTDTDATLHRSSSSLATAWPTGPWTDTTYDGPIEDYSLEKEGCYVKTVDFDAVNAEGGTWSEGTLWRNVQQGSSEPYLNQPSVRIANGATATEAVTVYVWSDDETVVKPVGSPMQTIDGKSVLTVTIPAGSSSATFALEGQAAAAIGATANVYMSPTQSAVYDASGTVVGNTVSRQVAIVSAPKPTVRVYLDSTETTKTVTAGPNWTSNPVELTFKIGAACAEDVTVDIKATVNGGSSLSALRTGNFLRITETAGFDLNANVTQVTFPAGSTTPITRYVYVLGASEDTEQYGIRFELAEPSGTTWPTDVSTTGGATLTVNRLGDEGVAVSGSNPASGSTVSAGKGEARTFKVKLADTYQNHYSATRYTFSLDDVDTGDTIATKADVTVKPTVFNNLTLTIPGDCAVGTYNCVLWATSPDGSTTPGIPYTLVVTASKAVTAKPTSGSYTACEGETVSLDLALNSPHSGSTPYYIFLEGATAADEALFTSPLKTTGATVSSTDNMSVDMDCPITLLDGTQSVTINAFLCKSQTNPSDTVAGFEKGTITLTVTNKPPVLNRLNAFGKPVATTAANLGMTVGSVPRGVPKKFYLTSVTDVDADLNAADPDEFQVKWVIDGTEYVKKGNPVGEGQAVTHKFTTVSTGVDGALVEVYLKDKDMTTWAAEPDFYFYVTVTDSPNLTITTSSGTDTFAETDVGQLITLTLSEPPTADIKVQLTIQKSGGYIKLREDDECVLKEETDSLITYEVTFQNGIRTKPLIITEMDGTTEVGDILNVNAEVTSEGLNDDGVRWCDYYSKAAAVQVWVQNVAPVAIRPTDAEVAATNENASANSPYAIKYAASDVTADFAEGIDVTIEIDGVQKHTDKLTSKEVQTYTAEFDGEGAHYVTVTFTDKDDSVTQRTVWFLVKPAKTLQLRAHGPATSVASDSGGSVHYGAAAGLGAGRVFAGDTGPQKVASFVHTYSFNETFSIAPAYAYGYQVTDAADNGDLSGSDWGIDANGDWKKGTTITDYYNYAEDHELGRAGFDSFLYAWVCNNVSSGSGNGSSTTQKTVMLNPGKKGEANLALGTKSNSDSSTTSYPMQLWEAVFSREYYTSDNCGDINLDGIPDFALVRFGLGVVNPTTGEILTTAGDEGDLTDVSSYNEDKDANGVFSTTGDFLPTADVAAYSAYIPSLAGTWDVPFTAKLELRGYGDHLNDAFAATFPDGTVNPLANADVTPDRVYTDPDTDSTSTLSKVEYLAWLEYAAANGLDETDDANYSKWSPERPTNPTKVDTDGDGISDGHEYHYWYLAHVGYLDANGNHKYLTGRRFDPKNPGEGTVITSEEIASLMDPIKSAGDAAAVRLRDSDNDGLPDILEIEVLGTNPFDFDTDGDGLPDGFEILVSKTDPLSYSTTKDGVCDAERNFDGDHMAYTTVFSGKDASGAVCLEEQTRSADGTLDAKPVEYYTSFAVLDSDGDTDGIQWYVVKSASLAATTDTAVTADVQAFEALVTGEDGAAAWTKAVVLGTSLPTVADSSGNLFLAKDFGPSDAFLNDGDDANLVRGVPLRLGRGTQVRNVTGAAAYTERRLTEEITAKNAVTAWVYGSSTVATSTSSKLSYGELTLGRHKGLDADAVVVAAPLTSRKVSLIHSYVYQEFGFDPRTAWSSKSPLAARWGISTVNADGDSVTKESAGNRAGFSTRTRPYTAYDEFLVMSYYLNGGAISTSDVTASKVSSWTRIFSEFTTNPRGPGEIQATLSSDEQSAVDGLEYEEVEAEETEYGADTDGDGVPDGWELYVMSGPKAEGAFKIAGPGAAMSPTVDMGDDVDADDDGLVERREFAGTDSCAAYAGYAATVSTRPSADAQWLNKFFPTDPWNTDTDGDGLDDLAERTAFSYGTPYDGVRGVGDDSVAAFLTSIPGGGLNPCSVDTDGDGLPDGWEAQFAGTALVNPADYVADGESTDDWYLCDTNGTVMSSCNTVAGYSDGMDGTVADAFSEVVTKETTDSTTTRTYVGGVAGMVDRDYDHDGLENWQEYLVGSMRCWRYDDPISPWVPPASSDYFDENGALKPNLEAFGCDNLEEFLYKTAFDPTSPLYNPQFVTDTSSGAQYFTRLENPWDPAYTADGAFYIFPDRTGESLHADTWGEVAKAATGVEFVSTATKYISCDPTKADTDQDGMDDYYELFHGLNPLLGESGVRIKTGLPCDIVYDALYSADAVVPSATYNYWTVKPWKTPRGNVKSYDFEVFPWLNGLATADPDGDDIRNQDEALLPKLSAVGAHTDPSPLWMTDSTYTNSLVSRFFRLPARFTPVAITDDAGAAIMTFEYSGAIYSVRDIPGFKVESNLLGDIPTVRKFLPDFWKLAASGRPNWMFSFEQNEGYDTDHDGHGDYDERAGKFTRSGSDPLDAESPTRRQAMYFQGSAAPSLLQALPTSPETYPQTAIAFANEYSFALFTAECWVCPETLDDATILERDVWTSASNPGDEEFLRRNFHLAVRSGKWYGCYDSNGTVDGNTSGVYSTEDATANAWTHLALTYDGRNLILYVNGEESGKLATSVTPESGSGALYFDEDQYFIGSDKYAYVALLVGASAKNYQDLSGIPYAMFHLDVLNGLGFGRYKNFYKGYVDEVRVWDGARTAAEIAGAVQTRYTADLIKANRAEIYDCWVRGYYRYATNGIPSGVTVPAELRYRYSFDSVPAAENANQVAKVPAGFGENGNKAPLSRPEGYSVAWWDFIVNGDGGTIAPGYGSVYNDSSWVTWIPNTVAHLPRFDGTTLDSLYWSEDFQGDVLGSYAFVHTAEPVSLWTQMIRNEVEESSEYITTSTRHRLVNGLESGDFHKLYRFAGRNRNTMGDDLLPLGGAYAKYVPATLGFWDGQGASSTTAVTGTDADNDGLPDWWQTYANSAYRWSGIPSGETVTWDTVVDYNGLKIAAWEAYLRDLAKGMYVDKDGNVQDGSGEYVQRADSAAAGVPDWWMELYGIKGESGLDDHDHDGLSNYHEYLLSEVFKFQGVNFDPTVADSVQKGVPDYFYRVGDLYVGEIFTDHDLVDDDWEDVYGVPYASRLAYDAFADEDEDGWSNRSENRYARQCQAIVANNSEHYSAVDGLVKDYPVPTLGLKVRYNGSRREAVNRARFVVMVFSEERGAGARTITDPDATYIVNSSELVSSEDDSTSTTEGSGNVYTKTLGRWSNRHVLGTLTPGSVNQGSLQFQFSGDPSALTYEWYYTWEWNSTRTYHPIHSGSLADLISARRKYGSDQMVVLSKESAYQELIGYTSSTEDETQILTWTAPGGSTLGTINLITGAYDINLGALEGQYVESTNSAGRASLEGQVYRIAYSANPSTGLPRSLYLGEASAGHVREGRNTVVVYADFDSSVDEETLQKKPWSAYAAGAPIGVAKGVDVSWRSGSAELELLETNPMFARYDLVTGDTDREARWPTNSAGVVSTGTGLVSSDANTRVRIVRYAVDSLSTGTMSGKDLAVVFDKTLRSMDAGSIWLTEADILGSAGCEFDLDWDAPALYSGSSRLSDYYEKIHGGVWQFTNVYYAVYLGNGDIPSASFGFGCMGKMIVRSFDLNRQRPTLLPSSASVGETGAAYDTIVYDAAPTFRWTMNGYDTYTAFRVNVLKDGTSIYDSGYQRMPPRNDKAEYSWQPPVFAGDKLPSGAVVENKSIYTWKLSVYNAKFRTDDFVTSEPYYLNVQTNSPFYGVQDVAVRYFGPKASYTGKTIRVQAFASPDFTGAPVAAGYVAAPDDADSGVAVTGKVVKANARLIGIPLGTYYLRAYIDSNNNGVWDPWETMGYFCRRDGTSANGLDVMSVRYSNVSGKGEIFQIFMEDADTDQDGLPDSWEYATYGSLTAKGVELLTATPAGEALVNTVLSGALEHQAGSAEAAAGIVGVASDAIRSAGVVALALGIQPASSGSFTDAIVASLSPELEEDGVTVTSIGFDDNGDISISVSAEASAPASASTLLAASATPSTTVSYKVLHVETLAEEWTTVAEGTMTISVGENEQTISLEAPAADATSGFYKVVLEK